ncbi:hypothetical protein Tcan_04464 [Toxocara canis]|uniref:C-type lectin domain-containing protein n=1 Tax=Toxocara canis TaxID=6265 RepID=A0A0B2V7D6_TOXCA|nr:hypothetical protein Tcan_04464 [Toxocara canis]
MSALGESTTSGSVSATDEISTPSAIGSFEKSSGFYERRVPGDSIAVNDSITPSSISTTEHRGVSEENTVPGNASTENTSETSNISTSEKSDVAKEVNIPTTGTTVDDTGVPYDTSTLERGSVLSEVAALSKASVDDASTPSNVSASKKSEVNVEDIAHDNTSVINDTRTLNKTNVPQEDTVIGQLPTNASIPEESAKPSVSGQLPTNASVPEGSAKPSVIGQLPTNASIPEGSAKPSVIGQLPTNASTPERSAKPSVIGQLPTNASIPEGSAKPSVTGQLPTDASIPEGSAKPSVIGQLPTNASISEGSAKPSIIGQLPTNASIPKGSAKPSDVSATAEVIDASTTTEPTTTANNITNISGTQPTPSNKTTPNKYSLVEGIKLNGSGIRRRGKKTKEECERLASLGSEAYMLTKNGTCITIGKVTAAYADPSQTYNTYVTKDVNVTKAVKDFRKKCPPNQYFTYNATSGDQKVIYTFIPMEIASYKKMGYRGEKGRYSSYYYRSKKCQQLCPKSHTFFVMSQQDLTNVIDAIQAYNRLSPAKNETLREYNMGFYFKKNNLSTWEDGTPYVNNIWPNFPSDIKGINSHSCVNLDITTGQPYLGNCYVEYDTVICERRCVKGYVTTIMTGLFALMINILMEGSRIDNLSNIVDVEQCKRSCNDVNCDGFTIMPNKSCLFYSQITQIKHGSNVRLSENYIRLTPKTLGLVNSEINCSYSEMAPMEIIQRNHSLKTVAHDIATCGISACNNGSEAFSMDEANAECTLYDRMEMICDISEKEKRNFIRSPGKTCANRNPIEDAIRLFNKFSPPQNQTLRIFCTGFCFQNGGGSYWDGGDPYIKSVWPNFPDNTPDITEWSCVALNTTTVFVYL